MKVHVTGGAGCIGGQIGWLRAAGFIPPGDFQGGLQTTIRFFKGMGK
jgi:hypothetical protein